MFKYYLRHTELGFNELLNTEKKLTKWIFCDQMKKALSLGLEKNFFGQNRLEFHH